MAGVIPSRDVPESNERIAFAVLRPIAQKQARGGASSVDGAHGSSDEDGVPNGCNNWEAAGILSLRPVEQPPSPTVETDPESTSAPQKRIAELGYLFVPEAWGFGYATESLDALLKWYGNHGNSIADQGPGTIVKAIVHPDNKASVRVLDKLGFCQTGRTDNEEMVFLGKTKRKHSILHFERVL